MNEICGDNRFEIIARAKEHLLNTTNIHTSKDEMKVLDNFLFRCWQMGWLDKYDRKTEPLTCDGNCWMKKQNGEWLCEHCQRKPKTEPNCSEIPNNCEHITEDGVTCAKYPACDDCLDNPLNKVKGSERLLKGNTEPTISKMEQVGTMSCQECKHWNVYKGCRERVCKYEPKDEPQTEREGDDGNNTER